MNLDGNKKNPRNFYGRSCDFKSSHLPRATDYQVLKQMVSQLQHQPEKYDDEYADTKIPFMAPTYCCINSWLQQQNGCDVNPYGQEHVTVFKLLKEKDQLINTLKQKNRLFEEQLHDLKKNLLSDPSENDALRQKYIKLEYRVTNLTEENRRLVNSSPMQKLRKAEDEIETMKMLIKKQKSESESEKEKAKNWEKMYQDLLQSQRDMKQKLDEYNRYLSTLPTAEDTTKRNEEMSKLLEKVTAQKQILKSALANLKEVVLDRDLKILELEKIKAEKPACHSELREDAHEMCHEKVKQMKAENNSLQAAVKHLTVIQKETVEKQEKEKEMVSTLKMEIANKDRQMEDMKNYYIMNLMENHQETNKEELDFEQEKKYLHAYFEEVRKCFFEIQNLFKVCKQKSKGLEIDASMLFGHYGDFLNDFKSRDMLSIESIEQNLEEVRQLYFEIKELQEQISEQLSDEMAKECTVQ